ncbi:amino acid transporter AVT1C-like [Zingiber officinale]|uniref:amino acid transporter AVT1C-like n=1 Tax=Zingiber officinale TaxID=94328 RepID=UPI001C4B8F12|nr:amino acid transporter AVT1C-like [Zingiber officinale]
MSNLASDRSLFIESEEEEEEAEDGVNEEGGRRESPSAAEEDSESSDSSSSPDDDGDSGSAPRSRPSSYSTNWPQSYRQSMDMYSSLTSPTIGFLGTPTLSRLSNSFISSSFRSTKHTPEIITSLIKPLLPTTVADQEQHDEIERRQSSHTLLLPSRKPSLEKIQEKVSHEFSIAKNCSYGQAVLNGINVLCGVGILSTPYAVKEGGWLSLSILLIFALLSWYTGILLRCCLDSEEGLETYPDIGQAAFGTAGRLVISIVLYLELYACCIEYILLERDNLSSLFPNAHLDLGGIHMDSHLLFAIFTTLVVLPTTWLRDLSLLSYISVGGVIASVLVVMSLFWEGAFDKVGFENKGTLLNLQGIPIAIGIYGYCYSGHAVFPNIYSSLKKPTQFPIVLFTCFAVCTLLFAGAAALGYTMFGESTMSQFTLNMPQNLVASKIAVWTTVVNPITKYALTIIPLAMSLEELIPSNHMKTFLYPIMIRTALVLSTLGVALSVPFFGLVMALVGSSLTMLVSLILPCVCFLSILRRKVTRTQGLLCIMIITIGASSSVCGTISSLSKIIDKLNQ